MMKKIKNGFIVKESNSLQAVTIYIENEKIKYIMPGNDNTYPADVEIDAEGNVIFSGFIDPHVHFDDPGFTEREDFETGTRSAAAGGITTVIDMPCTSIPPVTSGENFDNKLNIVSQKAYVDFAFWGGVTPEQIDNGFYKNTLRELKERGIVGVKFYTISGMELYPRMPVPEMHKAFSFLKDLNLVCAVHAEDFYLVDFFSSLLQEQGRTDPYAWFEGRVYQAEAEAIWSVLGITEKVGNKLHIVHLSSKGGLHVIRWGKDHGIDVTTETCPHYLLFNVDDLMRMGAILKTAPPIRRKEDNIALWEGLKDGTIDFISTDHAAGKFPDEKSSSNIWKNYAGIPGTQLVVPTIITYAYHKNGFTLEEVQKLLSENAAKRYGLYPEKGSLTIGTDADFSIVDINEEFKVDATKLESKGKYSPLNGVVLKGKVKKTIVRGEVVFDDKLGVLNKKGFGHIVRSNL
jgi:allantoinase